MPPSVTVLAAEPLVVKPGIVAFTGAASDGAGIGVQSVEVRVLGSPIWQPATGTNAWVASLNVPNAPTFALELRATDRYGQSSNAQTLTYLVDTTPPTVTLNLQATVSGTVVTIAGTTGDPAPAGVPVEWVEVQIDDGVSTTPWLAANGPYSPLVGTQGWMFRWNAPDADGATVRVRAQATDGAGNVSTSDWQTTTVDTRPPAVTVTTAISNISGAVPSPVLAGSATDVSGVSQVLIRVFAPDGTASIEAAVFNGSGWSWVPKTVLIPGGYQVRVEAIDRAGNVQAAGPFVISVGGAPVTPTPTPTPPPTPTPDVMRPRVRLPLVVR